MTRKTIVITGGTGLIGAALVQRLATEHEVHCVSRRPPPARAAIWHALDLAHACGFERLPQRADAVIYLAQSEYFRDFPAHSLNIYEVNTANVLRMLEYARQAGVKNFVYGSSGGINAVDKTKANENVEIPAVGDIGFYLSTKLCSELLAQNYAAFFKVAILRYFFVYGRGQRHGMLIPRLVQRVRAGEPIVLHGRDGIRINPVHVADAAEATRCALSLDVSMAINIAGPQVLSLRQIGEIIGEAVGRAPVFTVEDDKEPQDLIGDTTGMREHLTAPQIHFADGIKSLL
jgi:UDP-glucose 4-epimerase